jgi:hypothetical protein
MEETKPEAFLSTRSFVKLLPGFLKAEIKFPFKTRRSWSFCLKCYRYQLTSLLTESFDSKVADAGSPLVGNLEGMCAYEGLKSPTVK